MSRLVHAAPTSRFQQGGFLLEALVGILIFTLGVLGLVALQGRAIAYSSDAQFRGEAAYLANAYVSKMWADARINIPARYVVAGQPEFDAFQTAVFRLPGAAAIVNNPSVTIVQPAAGAETSDARGDGGNIALSATGTLVTIVIQWQPPSQDGTPGPIHNYTMSTIIAHN
jgi:type IV pilus assembly protein PilV